MKKQPGYCWVTGRWIRLEPVKSSELRNSGDFCECMSRLDNPWIIQPYSLPLGIDYDESIPRGNGNFPGFSVEGSVFVSFSIPGRSVHSTNYCWVPVHFLTAAHSPYILPGACTDYSFPYNTCPAGRPYIHSGLSPGSHHISFQIPPPSLHQVSPIFQVVAVVEHFTD